MTPTELISIKKYIECAYPTMKNNEDSDIVFADYFGKLDFQTLQKATKMYIEINKFPPTISQLLELYENVEKERNLVIISAMRKKGYFKEISEYEKATKWIERNIIPHWFKNDMEMFAAGKTSNRISIGKIYTEEKRQEIISKAKVIFGE